MSFLTDRGQKLLQSGSNLTKIGEEIKILEQF